MPQRIAASATLLAVGGLLIDGRLVVGATQPVGELVLDHWQAVLVGLLVERPLPLEARLALAADMPVGIAEMLDDSGVVALLLGGALQPLHGLVILPEAIEGPAHRIRDGAVVGPQLGG